MSLPSAPSGEPKTLAASPVRQQFLQVLATTSIRPTAHEYYARWAESWTKARGHQSAERTQAWFDSLTRSTSLQDWQFRQALDAARILACDVLAIPWASSFNWQSLADQARSLEPDHRTLARESIRVSADIPPQPSHTGPLPATDDEIARITDNLRRAIRLIGHPRVGMAIPLRLRHPLSPSTHWPRRPASPS